MNDIFSREDAKTQRIFCPRKARKATKVVTLLTGLTLLTGCQSIPPAMYLGAVGTGGVDPAFGWQWLVMLVILLQVASMVMGLVRGGTKQRREVEIIEGGMSKIECEKHRAAEAERMDKLERIQKEDRAALDAKIQSSVQSVSDRLRQDVGGLHEKINSVSRDMTEQTNQVSREVSELNASMKIVLQQLAILNARLDRNASAGVM